VLDPGVSNAGRHGRSARAMVGRAATAIMIAAMAGNAALDRSQFSADEMKKRFLSGYEEKTRIYETDESPSSCSKKAN